MRSADLPRPPGSPALGIVEGDEVVDLSAAGVPAEPAAALGRGGTRRPREARRRRAAPAARRARLLAPASPRKYLAIALNYADHIAEMGMEAPEVPVFFNKQVTCVVGPGAEVHMPKVSTFLDYEARAGDRDRQALPPRPGRARPRGDRRLHLRQRRSASATGRGGRRR